MSATPLQPSRPVLDDRRTWTVALLAVLVAFAGFMLAAPERSFAADPCAVPVANVIACENSKPGTPPQDWQTEGAGDPSIQGFATSMSVNRGETIRFKIKTDSRDYHIDILRLGYYGGDGARTVQYDLPITATLPQTQPACTDDGASPKPTGLIDCGNWGVTASWTVPTTMVSGVYIAHLVRDDAHGGDSQIPFVVRDDSSQSPMVVQTSDATWQAYNSYGGNSLYACTVACPPGNPDGYKGANSVSYNRPFDGTIPQDQGHSYLYYAEYQLIRFIEANGYDVSYVASKDVDSGVPSLLNHKVFISSGHDEYWTAKMRTNVETARDQGVNLAFFTGNEVFWKSRFEANARTLTTYKETHYNAKVDTSAPTDWTGTFADSRFSDTTDGGNPQNALTGQLFKVNAGSADIKVPAAFGKLRLWRNTAAASLTGNETLTLYPGGNALGYEWDVDADNGFRPPGLFRVSSTTVSNVDTFEDFGSFLKKGTATHNMTLYRTPSDALVFGSGTVQWSWGLDDTNAWGVWITNPSGAGPDRDMQQATVNLFADMGVQPYALLPGLVSATKSTDTTAPTATITSPTAGATVADGVQHTITGTATDGGGGQVAGVEVSTDGGTTWHPATSGTTSWTYSWIAHGSPSTTIRARAVDDSGNLGAASAPRTLNVTCDCSLFGSVTPTTVDSGDSNATEVGVKFKADRFGVIKGIRFYKATANTGTHIGTLWSADGQKLATATFQNETASGWQQVLFSSPVPVLANTTYVASYFAPRGHYSVSTPFYFNSPSPFGGTPIDAPPLHALKSTAAAPNGMYLYTGQSAFPTQSFNAANYYVDVVYNETTPPGQVTGVTATAGPASATITWTAPASGGPASQYTITPYLGSTAQTSTTVPSSAGTTAVVSGLNANQAYTFRVTASNPLGSGPASADSNTVTPSAITPPTAPRTVEATAASGTVKLQWLVPSSDGGRPITGYTVTPYIGATAQTPIQLGGSTTSTTVNGLTDGTEYTFRVTATNLQGTGAAGASNPVTPAATLFDFTAPAIPDSGDGNSVELGVKFKADSFGLIHGVRFYKGAGNTGTHQGSLWSADGALLASATFTNETGSGWQQVRFSTPVAVLPGQMYVASYYAPNGHYAITMPGFGTTTDRGQLHAYANGTTPNGVFAYGSSSRFPEGSFNASNYWVDVLYVPATAPGTPTGVSAEPSTASAKVTWTAASTGGPATKYTITPYLNGVARPATTVTGLPAPTTATVPGLNVGQTYTFRVTAENPAGTSAASAVSNAVTPDAGTVPGAPSAVTASAGTASARVTWTAPSTTGGWPISGYTVTPMIGSTPQTPVQVAGTATSATVPGLTNGTDYTFAVTATNQVGAGSAASSNTVTPALTIFDLGTPTTADVGDARAIELGVKFQADTYGLVTGVRFYKSALNTGTHIGSLWSATGTRLAQATFTSETDSGWQQVKFAQPVVVTPGTTYVASYFAPNGHHAITTQAFSTSVDAGPLHALADAGNGNGLFSYGATTRFPTSSFNASSYAVDVMYAVAPAPGTPTGVSATPGVRAATVQWTAPSTGGPVSEYVVTPYLGSTAQPSTSVTGNPPATTASITGLTGGASYTFKVTAKNPNGTGSPSAASDAITIGSPQVASAPTGVVARAATGSALVTWNTPASAGDAPITGYTVTPYTGTVAGTPVSVSATTRSTVVTGLTNGSATTLRVQAVSTAGTGAAGISNEVTPNYTLFEFGQPATVEANDSGSVVLGIKFRSDVAGQIRGIRFYKAVGNTGTHTGTLWNASGGSLASGTFTSETATGWQQLDFATPVSITAGTTYVASYHAPNGRYSLTGNGFGSAFDNPPLHALANTVSSNGVYAYGGPTTFPTNSWNATNYFVDVLFSPAA